MPAGQLRSCFRSCRSTHSSCSHRSCHTHRSDDPLLLGREQPANTHINRIRDIERFIIVQVIFLAQQTNFPKEFEKTVVVLFNERFLKQTFKKYSFFLLDE